jgi:hypothetical protein
MSSPERQEQPKNDLEESVTFHNGEQNKLKDFTENTKSKIVGLTKNHPLEL